MIGVWKTKQWWQYVLLTALPTLGLAWAAAALQSPLTPQLPGGWVFPQYMFHVGKRNHKFFWSSGASLFLSCALRQETQSCPKTDWKKQPGPERNTRDTIFISFKPKSKLFHFILLIINFFCASPVAMVTHQQTCTTGGTGWTQRQRVGLQAKGSQSPRPTSLSITRSLGLQDMDSAASYLGSEHCPWDCALWLLPLTSMTMPSHLYFSSVAVTLPQRGFPDHILDVSAPSAQQIDCLVLASILCCNHHYLKWSFFFRIRHFIFKQSDIGL